MSEIKPVAGQDYPKTWSEFQDWLASDEACAAYLEQLRGPTGFCCPACGVMDTPGRASRGRLICRACRHQSSVTAGTIFDKTRTSLKGHDRGHLVAIAVGVEVHEPKGYGRIRLRRVQGPTMDSLLPFVREHIAPGTKVRTDGSPIYGPLRDEGFVHDPHIILGSKAPAHEPLPGVHRIAALLKRWLLGTHQGAIDPRHVDSYLDEFTFRFNRRTSRSPGMLFYRLIQQSAIAGPVTYVNIRDKEHQLKPSRAFTGSAELNG